MMRNLKPKLSTLLRRGLYILTGYRHSYSHDADSLNRMLRMAVVSIVGFSTSLIIIVLGTFEVHYGTANVGFALWLIGFLMFTNLFLLRSELPYKVGATIVVVLYGVFCALQLSSLVITDSSQRVMSFWFNTFPAVAIFSLGWRLALPFTLILFGIEYFQLHLLNTPPRELIRCSAIYALLLALTLLYEYARSLKDDFVERLNADLIEQRNEATKLKEAAEVANVAKTQFLSRTTHELRTPLSAIIGMTTIAQNSNEAEKITNCLTQISKQSDHLLNIIDDILEISDIEMHSFELNIGEFDLPAMLEQAADTARFYATGKNQTFTPKIAANLPKRISADEKRLLQIVSHLLNNAVKFTPEYGAITFIAEISKTAADRGECELHLLVSDNGIGLTAEQQQKLFRPFEQTENALNRRFGGNGLGLAICKHIVEAMRGEIVVHSELDRGATFEVFAPIVPIYQHSGNTEVINVPAIAPTAENTNYDFTGYRVLLVDDVAINREIINSFVEDIRLQVDEAENGQEAVDKFTADPARYQLILMDVQMPVMDGYEATRQIRAHPAGETIPIVALTANMLKGDIESCLAAGMNLHLSKPVDCFALLDILHTYLLPQSKPAATPDR